MYIRTMHAATMLYLCIIFSISSLHAAETRGQTDQNDSTYFIDPLFYHGMTILNAAPLTTITVCESCIVTADENDFIKHWVRSNGAITRAAIIENAKLADQKIPLAFLAGWMLSATDNTTIRAISVDDPRGYTIANKEIIHTLTASQNPYNCYLFSGGDSRTVQLWDIQKRNLVQKYSGHEKEVTQVLEGNNNTIVSNAWDTIKVWDFETGKQKNSITHHSRIIDMTLDKENLYFIDETGWLCQVAYETEQQATAFIKPVISPSGIIATGQLLLTRTDESKYICFYDPRMKVYIGGLINTLGTEVTDMAFYEGKLYVASDKGVGVWCSGGGPLFKSTAPQTEKEKKEANDLYS
ncbi:MAG: WD40 repeat domain-containing protein [Candidatus Babeliales bacterium]